MASSKETLLVKACQKGDLTLLNKFKSEKINLKSKSRMKDFDNLFQRCLYESSKTSKEYDVITILCNMIDDINVVVTEQNIISLLARGKQHIIDLFIKNGFIINKNSDNTKYHTIYDRLFRESLVYQRVDALNYLLKYFNIKYIDINAVVKIIVNNESAIEYVDIKLKNTIEDYDTMFNFLMKNGLDISEVIHILN